MSLGCGPSTPNESVGVETEALVLPTQVSSFAVLTTGRAVFGDRTAVAGGNVGATATTGDAITVGSAAVFALGKATVGRRIVLKERASAGDLFTNSVSAPLATFSSLSAFGAPPAAPPIVAFTAGTAPVTANAPTTLAAGNFGVVTVNSTLTLSGGTYQIQNLVLGNNAIVQASAPTIVRIAGRITATTANHVHLITTGAQPASNLRIIVAGATDTAGGVSLGTDAQVNALVVSKAAFTAADRLDFTGALAASNVTVGNDSHVTFATGFECNADSACNDGNPCTTDACTDARCVHTTLANGTACTDDSNSCTSDMCSAGTCAHPTLADGTACGTAGGSCGAGTCSKLIGSVTLDKTTVCRGDTVLAQVTTTPGATAVRNSILIDGKPGGKRYVMLDGVPGNRKVIVTVGIAGDTEVRELNVQVVDCPGQNFPNLAFAANQFHENVVDLRVLNAADLGTSPSYQWNFGDGTSATSNVPYVAHDYGPKLDRDTELSTFQASVTVIPVGGQPQLGKRTAAIPNFYAINKHQRKLMVPTVQQSPQLLHQGSTFVGSYTISRRERPSYSMMAVRLIAATSERTIVRFFQTQPN